MEGERLGPREDYGSFLNTNPLVAGELAHWVKCLPYKNKNLRLNPGIHFKKLGAVVNTCNSRDAEMGGRACSLDNLVPGQ